MEGAGLETQKRLSEDVEGGVPGTAGRLRKYPSHGIPYSVPLSWPQTACGLWDVSESAFLGPSTPQEQAWWS